MAIKSTERSRQIPQSVPEVTNELSITAHFENINKHSENSIEDKKISIIDINLNNKEMI